MTHHAPPPTPSQGNILRPSGWASSHPAVIVQFYQISGPAVFITLHNPIVKLMSDSMDKSNIQSTSPVVCDTLCTVDGDTPSHHKDIESLPNPLHSGTFFHVGPVVGLCSEETIHTRSDTKLVSSPACSRFPRNFPRIQK